ncbi:MAG: DUF853 domain-containing protein [Lachnospiraceae bacterium]|nr:DUF853 domain-containing protein [Lachnospiraceae bacterium]
MYIENKAWIGMNENGEKICLSPRLANRHGLIAGATGTGKTVTLKVMAETFSDMGVPVFIADVKGDIAGLSSPGADSTDMQKRISDFGLDKAGFEYCAYPVTFWDIFGQKGIPLRTTISEMGPLLLARALELSDVQSDILSVIFKIADDNNLLLIDTKDLKAALNFVDENHKDFEADYGKMSSSSITAIIRAIVALEGRGGDAFFGETALSITDWFSLGEGQKGMIHVLDSQSLINDSKLYSVFLLWLLSELFETLPEVGDMDKPKMVFFFDEAHLLFNDAPKVLTEKIEQVVKLIRSKGVGVYFVTQNPLDIPGGVLSQLGNKVLHALRAYTPADQKSVKAAAESFRVNPAFDTYDAILSLGTGEAIVSFLEENGEPGVCQKTRILPPHSLMAGIDDNARDSLIKQSLLYSKYAQYKDPDSAYEFLMRRGEETAAQKAAEEAEVQKTKLLEKEQKAMDKKAKQEAAKQAAKEATARNRALRSVGNTIAGTVGRELGKNMGSSFGSFGKKLGGNVGASLGRGILSTLFK